MVNISDNPWWRSEVSVGNGPVTLISSTASPQRTPIASFNTSSCWMWFRMEHLKADVQDFGLNTFGDSNASCGCIAGCSVEKELYEPRQFFHFVVDIWLIATRKSLKPWQCSRSSQLVEFPSRSEPHHLLHELFCWPDKILLAIPGNKWKNEEKKSDRSVFCFVFFKMDASNSASKCFSAEFPFHIPALSPVWKWVCQLPPQTKLPSICPIAAPNQRNSTRLGLVVPPSSSLIVFCDGFQSPNGSAAVSSSRLLGRLSFHSRAD